MKGYTNITVRTLLESDASLRKVVRELNANKEDIYAWHKAHRAAVRNGFLLTVGLVNPSWPSPRFSDVYITGIITSSRTLVYAFEAPRSRFNHTQRLSRLTANYTVDYAKIPEVLAHLVDDYEGI